MRSSTIILGSSRCLVSAYCCWNTRVSISALCANVMFHNAFCANVRIPGGILSLAFTSFIIVGIYPQFILKGASLVASPMLELIANSIIGHHCTQSFWSGLIRDLNICPMDLLAHSVAPSVCGWNDVDMSSFVPKSRCSSRHHFDVNLGSRSLTIDDGSPWSHTISHM